MTRLELTRALAQKLPQVDRGWRRMADAALAELRVSSSAGWCLVHIAALGHQARQAELADRLGITQPSLVRTLDQLEGMGLVERVADPQDKRSNRIAFTPAGEQLAEQIDARLSDLRRDLLEGVPDAAIEITVNLLELLGRRTGDRRKPG